MRAREDVQATWYYGHPDLPQLGHLVTMFHARPTPCNAQCPWLSENHGTSRTLYDDHEVAGIVVQKDPFEFAPWKRVELWQSELKDGTTGYASLCHVRLAGTQRNADDTWHIVGRQCTGALVMQQRELLRHLVDGKSALSAEGAAMVASVVLGRRIASHELVAISRRELLQALHPALTDPAIGCEAIAGRVEPDEIRRWGEWAEQQTEEQDTLS